MRIFLHFALKKLPKNLDFAEKFSNFAFVLGGNTQLVIGIEKHIHESSAEKNT